MLSLFKIWTLRTTIYFFSYWIWDFTNLNLSIDTVIEHSLKLQNVVILKNILLLLLAHSRLEFVRIHWNQIWLFDDLWVDCRTFLLQLRYRKLLRLVRRKIVETVQVVSESNFWFHIKLICKSKNIMLSVKFDSDNDYAIFPFMKPSLPSVYLNIVFLRNLNYIR